jgi:hypothetical protein
MVTSTKDGMWCNHGNPTMLNNSNPLLSKAYLTNLNLIHFKMVEAMGLRITASRSPLMASPPYQISRKSTTRFKSWWGDRQTQTGWWSHKPISIFGRLVQTSMWKVVRLNLNWLSAILAKVLHGFPVSWRKCLPNPYLLTIHDQLLISFNIST